MDLVELIFWGVLFVVLVVVETTSVQLIAIWFAIGSAASFVSSLLHASFPVQLIVFIVTSTLLLLVTRPFLKKVMHKSTVPTNADAIIGKSGIVTQSIENVKNQGRAKIDGLTWSVRSIDDGPIPEGEIVHVVKIEGVTAFVTAKHTSEQHSDL